MTEDDLQSKLTNLHDAEEDICDILRITEATIIELRSAPGCDFKRLSELSTGIIEKVKSVQNRLLSKSKNQNITEDFSAKEQLLGEETTNKINCYQISKNAAIAIKNSTDSNELNQQEIELVKSIRVLSSKRKRQEDSE